MASTESSTLKTYSSKIENPKQPTAASLQIRLKHRHQVHLQTHNDAGTQITFVHEVSSPVVTSDCLAMVPHVLAFPRFRQRCILKALARVNIDESLGECLRPQIERFVVEKTQAFGLMGFAVVDEIEVTKIEGPVDDPSRVRVRVRQRRGGLDAKADVCDCRRTFSLVAALDRKKVCIMGLHKNIKNSFM